MTMLTTVASLLLMIAPVHAAEPGATAACRALKDAAHAATLMAIPDAPTTILSAEIVPAGGDGSVVEADLPEICRVEGRIAPTVGFLLRLPTSAWNGKFLMGGCGGACGTYMTDRIDPALVRGYAVVVTDLGHKGDGFAFMLNNLQAQIDTGYRATHVTAAAAKEIVAAFYGRRASRNYYAGCSTGGRQGMVEAQRFPKDFEGIIAGAPVWNQMLNNPMFNSWGAIANTGADGKPILDSHKLPLIHKAALAACDAADGLADGIIQDPRRCTWDPAALQCKGKAADQCLTAAEVDVVRKIYDGPKDKSGTPLFFGMARGSELQWSPMWINSGGKPGLAIAGGFTNSAVNFAALGAGDPAHYSVAHDFDYTRDPPRLALQEWIFNAQNPDLRAFKAAGGKLILYAGWHDNNIPPGLAIDYYETATRTMGGPEHTRDFFRLFLPPAMNHCWYGEGGGEVDWLSALEAWVEQGRAPDSVIAYHMTQEPYPSATPRFGETLTRMPRHPLPSGSSDRARPVFAYPDAARYAGRGDPALPASWEKAGP